MKNLPNFTAISVLIISVVMFSTCGKQADISVPPPETQNNLPDQNTRTRELPNLQAEILDTKNTLTTSPIGKLDFKNYTYVFPRGWQDIDNKEFTLVHGKRPMTNERIGITFLTTKYLEVTGDGDDDAFVILKIDTGGGGIPHAVYVFTRKGDQPELIWQFRTGDKADGGLKTIWAENGDLVVELFGQDRYILGEVETMRIDGDEEQRCCPTHFTRTHYKWNGTSFAMHGKRATFSMKDQEGPPVENMNNKPEKEKGGTKK